MSSPYRSKGKDYRKFVEANSGNRSYTAKRLQTQPRPGGLGSFPRLGILHSYTSDCVAEWGKERVIKELSRFASCAENRLWLLKNLQATSSGNFKVFMQRCTPSIAVRARLTDIPDVD
ncbi:hypothetical protein C8F01DRAFT_1081658 [Mycena amicta]|nr:hypothetical protein C8F01DRAFT_1081658 [Mycena amicta]